MSRRLLILLSAITVAIAAWARQYSVADVPNVHLTDSTRYVSDPDGILSQSTAARLDRKLTEMSRATSAEMAVVVLGDIDSGTDIDRFATDLFTDWGIGKADRDNGLLVLLVKDQRAVTIRTGQGTEGVVTDLAAGRVIRNIMTPYFKNGDYDGGLEAGVDALVSLVSDPDSAGELRSDIPNNSGARSGSGDSADFLWHGYLMLALIAGAGALVLVIWRMASSRKSDDVTRYRSLEKLKMPMLFVAFLSLGIGVPALLLLTRKLRKLRLHPRNCSHCGAAMRRLGEEEDNRYLTPVQDAEERLDSIDYDVWLCPQCHKTDIIPYVNRQSAFTECPRCHGRTRALLSDSTVTPPTTMAPGRGVRTYTCRHCGWRHDDFYNIPRIIVPPPVHGSGRGGGFGGGGFGGGSFGGGSTMGGGATGRW